MAHRRASGSLLQEWKHFLNTIVSAKALSKEVLLLLYVSHKIKNNRHVYRSCLGNSKQNHAEADVLREQEGEL